MIITIILIIIAIQDKFTLTKFSLLFVFGRIYSLFVFEVVCWQTLQVQWFSSQQLIMALKGIPYFLTISP